MAAVTNLTSALRLPQFVSTVSASLAQDLPGMMFLSTGSVTNRAQIENITTSIFPFAVQPGFSLANLFDASLPVGGIFTNPVSVAQQPFIPGLLSVTNQANLPQGILPNFPVFAPGAFNVGQNPAAGFPLPQSGNILLGGLDPRIPQAGGVNPGATGISAGGLLPGGAVGGGLPNGGIQLPAGAIGSPGGQLIAGANGLPIQVGGQGLAGLLPGVISNGGLGGIPTGLSIGAMPLTGFGNNMLGGASLGGLSAIPNFSLGGLQASNLGAMGLAFR